MFGIAKQLESAGIESCFISEITVAELKYGAENSAFPEKNLIRIKQLQQLITVIPIFNAIDVYAKEKARLKKSGNLLDDFDLLIGATAIANNLVLVTRNVSDFARLEGIKIENWTLKGV